MIPAAGAAYLHHVYGELVVFGGQQDQLLCGAGRSGYRAEMVAKHPRHQRQLFLAADRAHDRAGLAVELRCSKQVRIGVADFRDTRAPRVHLGQQGSPPEGVIHHLSLQSHEDQSTSAGRAPRLDVRPEIASTRFGNDCMKSGLRGSRANSYDLRRGFWQLRTSDTAHAGQRQRSQRDMPDSRHGAGRRSAVDGRTR